MTVSIHPLTVLPVVRPSASADAPPRAAPRTAAGSGGATGFEAVLRETLRHDAGAEAFAVATGRAPQAAASLWGVLTATGSVPPARPLRTWAA